MKTKIVANIKGGEIPDFTANGSRVLSLGWLACETEARGEDVELPLVKINEELKLKKTMKKISCGAR